MWADSETPFGGTNSYWLQEGWGVENLLDKNSPLWGLEEDIPEMLEWVLEPKSDWGMPTDGAFNQNWPPIANRLVPTELLRQDGTLFLVLCHKLALDITEFLCPL